MHIPILTGVHKGRINRKQSAYILIKKCTFKLNFQDKGLMYANFLISVLTIYRKCLLFQFLGCDICIFPYQQEFKMDKLVAEKMVIFCY